MRKEESACRVIYIASEGLEAPSRGAPTFLLGSRISLCFATLEAATEARNTDEEIAWLASGAEQIGGGGGTDQADRRADEFAGAERDHRGGAGRRGGARFRWSHRK